MLTLAEKDPRELAVIAEQVRRSLRAPIRIAGQDIVLTASIGLSVYDGQQQEGPDLLKEAEVAMYRAKRAGADRIEIFTPEMRAERDDRVAIESDLRKAIEKRQIRVLYQPIISLATEQLAGFEALVRWEHPKLGLLNPAEFIPVAEESDLIVKLGSVVLDKAVTEAARWQKELPRSTDPLFVSVNVSSRQLFRPELVQEVRQLLGRAVIPTGSLRLEVTESLVMENAEQAAEVLEWLRGAGAGLSLDDFGTGYSSLAYLQTFPFDTIKIDRAIIQAGLAEGSGSPIVRSIVALSHELGKKVVAEGVETASDVGFLRSLGCELAQGFYYGEPMPEREVLQLLKVIRKSERKLQRRGFFRTKTRSQPQPSQTKPAAAPAAMNVPATNGGVPSKRIAAAVAGGQARIRSRSAQQVVRPAEPEPRDVPTTRPQAPPPPQQPMQAALPPVQPVPPYQPPPSQHSPHPVMLQPITAVLDTAVQSLAPPLNPAPPQAFPPPQPPARPAPPPPSLAQSVGRAFEPPRVTTQRPTDPPAQSLQRPRPAPVGGNGSVGRQVPPAMSASLARLAGRTSGSAATITTTPTTKPPKSES
jgi:EAL domain-containing protein (putative c-di-GMP-specific phosphodiesterase class I)